MLEEHFYVIAERQKGMLEEHYNVNTEKVLDVNTSNIFIS